MKIICHLRGHKPVCITLDDKGSSGFVCWRCGIRLGWDGRNGFSPFYDYKTGLPIMVSVNAFSHAKEQRLIKRKHWSSTTEDDDKLRHSKGELTMNPIHPKDLPKWVKKLDRRVM